jgi:Zn-dependent protease
VSLAAEVRRRRFHQLGPWILVGTVVVVALIAEAVHRHTIDSEDVWYFVVLIPSIILHEVSHGAVANACGDTTAKDAGRLTLNPFKHVDLFGTILLPILMIFTTGVSFGWAKPVPVSINRLRHPRNQAVLVGLAGPAVNVALAALCALVLHLLTHGQIPPSSNGSVTGFTLGYELLYLAGLANVIIAAFNLIPLPPLDGSSVVERLLPASMLPGYYRLRPYSMILVLVLVIAGRGLLDSLYDHVETFWFNIAF